MIIILWTDFQSLGESESVFCLDLFYFRTCQIKTTPVTINLTGGGSYPSYWGRLLFVYHDGAQDRTSHSNLNKPLGAQQNMTNRNIERSKNKMWLSIISKNRKHQSVKKTERTSLGKWLSFFFFGTSCSFSAHGQNDVIYWLKTVFLSNQEQQNPWSKK